MGSPRQPRIAPGPAPRPDDCRCRCGSLVARIVTDGVEIKCRRCKRDLLVPWSAREGWVRPVERPEPQAHAQPEPQAHAQPEPLAALPGGSS